MSANITSGNYSSYEAPGIRIFQSLKPDVVAIQEFKYNNSTADAQLRQLVDTAFGTSFSYYREPYTASDSIPNGIVSRWPIIGSGSWDDPLISNRGFAWAQIDLPGTNDLYVVSVHLYSSGTASQRNTEATTIKNQIMANFPSNAWIIVAGDFNTDSRSEAAVTTFKTFLSDNPIPADQAGDSDTSGPRSKPYDYLLPSFSFTNCLASLAVSNQSFPNGLVFDSRVYTPLINVPPVQSTDSGAANMQHMAVLKAFQISFPVTNYISDPPTISSHPQSQTVAQGSNVTFTVTADGAPPLAYQWRFGSSNIVGATTNSYTRMNAQPSAAGDYCVVVTNPGGSRTSLTATLTVIVPPAIMAQPSAQTVGQGANATFTVTATGSDPLGYQWRYESADLPGATTSVYTRSNVQPAHVGVYSVVVTNWAGATNSANAELSLMVPPPVLTTPAAGLIQWQGLSNLTYTVQAKTNFEETTWMTVGTASSPGSSVSFTNQAAAPHRLYRVVYP